MRKRRAVDAEAVEIARAELRRRFHDDVIAEPTTPAKRLRIITTSDPQPGPAELSTTPATTEPEPGALSLRDRWRALMAELRRLDEKGDDE